MEEASESKATLAAGTMVGGRFRVERLIGRGGMGEVYAARHVTTGKEVALKLIIGAAGNGKDHVRRFLREAKAATAIEHPNVIQVLDVFEDSGGTPVMVMELLKGEPFSEYRRRVGALRLHEVSAILLPVVRGLKAAHDKGIVHRDLKPDNIFLAQTAAGRTPKLLDFGIAKVLDPTKLGSETQGQHTNTGSILGTPHYMSYEQAMSDKRVDHRTDIWSIGVIVFESLTGVRPLAYETLGQMYTAFLQGQVPSMRDGVADAPPDFVQVIDRCLVKEADGRLGDLAPLIEVLAKYVDPSVKGAHAGGRVLSTVSASSATASTASPLSRSTPFASDERPKRRGGLPVVGGLVAAVAALTGIAFAVNRRAVDPRPGVAGAHSDDAPATLPVSSGAPVGSLVPVEAGLSEAASGRGPTSGATTLDASVSAARPDAGKPAFVRHEALRSGAAGPTTSAHSEPSKSSGPSQGPKGLSEKDPYK